MTKRLRSENKATADGEAKMEPPWPLAPALGDLLVMVPEVVATLILAHLEMTDLNRWHRVCRAHAHQWTQLDHILRVLQAALDCAQAEFARTLHQRHHRRMIAMDEYVMGMKLARYVAYEMLPRVALKGVGLAQSTVYNAGTVARALATIDETRIQDVVASASECPVLPSRVATAFYNAMMYIRCRYGWLIRQECSHGPDRIDAKLTLEAYREESGGGLFREHYYRV
jgi:hypothetical protein